MKAEKEIIDELVCMEQDIVDRLCEEVKEHNINMRRHLIDIVASLCEVDVNTMMSNTKSGQESQARWLFWLACRYMTNEPFSSIAKQTQNYGWHFSTSAITNACTKMSALISQNTVWTKRWAMLRRIIKAVHRGDCHETVPSSITLKVVVPKGVNIEFKTECNDKKE